MNIRFVVRPSTIRATPRALAAALDTETRRVPGWRREPDPNRDFIFGYPYDFFNLPKGRQREAIAATGVPVPATAHTRYEAAHLQADQFVVRPLRHQGGHHFRLTRDNTDFREGREYISELWPKTREYRIIYVYGQPLVVMRKRVPEGVGPEQPWNYDNGARFFTCHEPTRLATRTTALTDMSRCSIIQQSHIVGVDFLYRRGRYAVCEFNSCPSLSVEDNIQQIADFIRARRINDNPPLRDLRV